MATAIEVAEKPILFSGEMVRALLDGRKTQTRRVIKPQPEDCDALEVATETDSGRLAAICACEERGDGWIFCPYGKPGDRLWVRETWATDKECSAIAYRADLSREDEKDEGWIKRNAPKLRQEYKEWRWKPSIHMPRAYSRLSLEITEVRVERVQDITAKDSEAEGVQYPVKPSGKPGKVIPMICISDRNLTKHLPKEPYTHESLMVAHFAGLWDSINEKRGFGWEKNPFVWAITFKRDRGEF